MASTNVRRWRPVTALAPILVTLASSLLAALAAAPLRADVTAEGDVAPQDGLGFPILPEDGGIVIGDIIVGGTGSLFTGGIPIGRVIIDNPAFTLPLTSTNGFIGGANQDGGGEEDISANSLGLVTVSGFFSQWNITEVLSVGGFGQGYLEITGGALVSTGDPNAPTSEEDDSFVGDEAGSQGFVTISGFGSRLTTKTLRVGREGFGRVDVTTRGRLESRDGAILGDRRVPGNNAIGEGHVVIDGLGTRWNVGDQTPNGGNDGLTIGNEGRGTVEVRNGGLVRVNDDTRMAVQPDSYGEIIVNGRDSMFWTFDQLTVAASGLSQAEIHVENEGTLRADQSMTFGANAYVDLAAGGKILTPLVNNFGVIRGDGLVNTGTLGVVTNDGYIRNAAGIANTREKLVFTGPVVNNDNIESVGGEMEFQRLVTNSAANGDIVGINAIFRFNGGLQNSGRLYLKNSLIYTLGVQSSEAFVVLEGESQLRGNLTFTSTSDFVVEVGHTSSLLSVLGNVTLGGTLVVTGVDDVLGSGAGDGWAPNLGDSFEILTGNIVAGTFSSVVDSFANFDFQAVYEPTRVLLNVIAGNVVIDDADFGGPVFNDIPDGNVDGFDFLAWQQGYGTGVPPDGTTAVRADGDANNDGRVDDADFLLWSQQFGQTSAVAAVGVVPEPTAAVLVLSALALLPYRKRR